MDASHLRELIAKYDRGYALNERALQDVLDGTGHGTAFKEWISMHLGSENLLSKEELALYSSLDQAGSVDELVASHGLATVQALDEDELKAAVQKLDRSTAAIAKQTETLRLHHEALAKLVDGNAKLVDSRSGLESTRAGRQAAERRKLASRVEDLSQQLGFRTTELEQQVNATLDNAHQIIDRLLDSDDKLLSSLQKLGWELDPGEPEEVEHGATLRENCMRLIKYTVETTRAKLDRMYLESLEYWSRDVSNNPPASEVNALQEEVESLYAEILPVAQMSVEQQHLEPALTSLSDRNGLCMSQSTAAMDYILSCLEYLVDHISRLEARVAAMQSHNGATTTLIVTTKTELAVPVAQSKKTPLAQPASPVRPQALRDTRGTRHGSPAATSNESSKELPIGSLLRLLAVNLATSSGVPNGTPNVKDIIRTLARALEGRAVKATDLARDAQDSFEKSTTTHMADSRRAIQFLQDSILAESSFGEEVKLVDPEVEGLIIELGQEIADVQSRVEQAEVERHGVAGATGERRREFIQRWAR